MAGKKHTHKYYQVPVSGEMVWACALPDCTHYMPKHMEHFIPNKTSICWSCGEKFTMDALAMQCAKPVCNDCNPAKQALLEAIESLK